MNLILTHIHALPPRSPRRLVAVAGPPASGKSTLAEQLAASDPSFVCVPMDGFHLDNAVLTQRGLLDRKGAPETFDAVGFLGLVRALITQAEVPYPLFDRAADATITNAARMTGDHTTVIVEGNYLLLDHPVWRDLAPLWDLTIFLSVPDATLTDRLTQRWIDHGLTPDAALKRAEGNDLPNARLVNAQSLRADITLT